MYIGLLSLLILAEAGVLLLLFTNNAWRQRIPGEEPTLRCAVL